MLVKKIRYLLWKYYGGIAIVLLLVLFNYAAVIPFNLLLKYFDKLPGIVGLILSVVIVFVVGGVAIFYLFKFLLKFRPKLYDKQFEEFESTCRYCTCSSGSSKRATTIEFENEMHVNLEMNIARNKAGLGFLKVVSTLENQNKVWAVKINYCPFCGGKYKSIS